MSKKKRRKRKKTVKCEICNRGFDEDILTLRLFGITVCLDCLAEVPTEEIERIAREKRKWGYPPVEKVIEKMMGHV